MFLEFRKRFRRRVRRRTTAAAPEFDFPEPIIQLIQSFLTSKEAARTTLLSKPWRSAWLTRPNLDFDQAEFRGRSNKNFFDFLDKTLERYENFNLSIESFNISYEDRPDSCLTKLIHRALKLAPTHLTFKSDHEDEICPSEFHIPDEVYRYENLLSLTVNACEISPNREEICCSRLQFLSLNDIWSESHKSTDMIFRIISSCPLIEKLSLCHIFDRAYDDSAVGDRLPTITLHRLKSLVLENVFFDSLFLADLSFKFPSLKDLTLRIKKNKKKILISSPTLERLDFNMVDYTVQMVKLDVPSIRKLTFECSSIPKLFVASNSRGLEESYVSVTRSKSLSASWFYRLSDFLKKLKFSKISLSLHVSSETTFEYEPRDIRGLPKSEIENLNIYHMCLPSLSCYVLFDGLFRLCQPKVITQYMSRESVPVSLNDHFLVKRFLEAREAKVPTPKYQFMYSLNDLKEARAQVFDVDVSTWRDFTLESFLDEDWTTSEEDHQSEDESWDELSKASTTTYETDEDDDSTVIGGSDSDYDSSSNEESDYDSTTVDKFPVIRFRLNWKQ